MKVSEDIRLIEQNDWDLVATRGSHWHYKHPSRPGRVAISGYPSHDVASGTLNSIFKQTQLHRLDKRGQVGEMYRFLIVIEKANGNYSACLLGLPG